MQNQTVYFLMPEKSFRMPIMCVFVCLPPRRGPFFFFVVGAATMTFAWVAAVILLAKSTLRSSSGLSGTWTECHVFANTGSMGSIREGSLAQTVLGTPSLARRTNTSFFSSILVMSSATLDQPSFKSLICKPKADFCVWKWPLSWARL